MGNIEHQGNEENKKMKKVDSLYSKGLGDIEIYEIEKSETLIIGKEISSNIAKNLNPDYRKSFKHKNVLRTFGYEVSASHLVTGKVLKYFYCYFFF